MFLQKCNFNFLLSDSLFNFGGLCQKPNPSFPSKTRQSSPNPPEAFKVIQNDSALRRS